jgi:hypothetical protein
MELICAPSSTSDSGWCLSKANIKTLHSAPSKVSADDPSAKVTVWQAASLSEPSTTRSESSRRFCHSSRSSLDEAGDAHAKSQDELPTRCMHAEPMRVQEGEGKDRVNSAPIQGERHD